MIIYSHSSTGPEHLANIGAVYRFEIIVLTGAFLQATSRVPRWWIGERPPDMAASCDIYK